MALTGPAEAEGSSNTGQPAVSVTICRAVSSALPAPAPSLQASGCRGAPWVCTVGEKRQPALPVCGGGGFYFFNVSLSLCNY